MKDYLLNHAVMTAYRRVIEPRRYPAAVLYVDLEPAEVDVNVHPAKLEVRFRQPQTVYEAIVEALSAMLRGMNPGSSPPLPSEPAEAWSSGLLPKEEVASRIAEALRRYPLASGTRKMMYGTQPEAVRPEAVRPLPMPPERIGPERIGEEGQDSVETALFPRSSSGPRNSLNPAFAELPFIGALWDTYLIFSVPEGMLLIDQHAAHERVLFERIRKGAQSAKPAVQALLLPEVLTLGRVDFDRFTTMMPLLEQVGVDAEPFGGDAVIVKALPALLSHLEPGALLKDLIAELSEKADALSLQERGNKIYALLACKGAIKAGHPLSREEVAQLCRDLDATPFAATCPHGRPVYILYSLKDIERMFHRR